MDLQEIVTSLRAGGKEKSSFCGEKKYVVFPRTLHTDRGAQSASYSDGTEFYFLGVKKKTYSWR